MKILIVDDHSIIRRTIRAMIDKNVTVLEADNGESGYAQIKANPDITIVLTDFNMPKVNGLQMLEAMRRDMPNFHPKIVFISSERDQSLLDKAKNLGVTGWLLKPFKKEDLVAVLSQPA